MCQSHSQNPYRRSARTRIIVTVNMMPNPFFVRALGARAKSYKKKMGAGATSFHSIVGDHAVVFLTRTKREQTARAITPARHLSLDGDHKYADGDMHKGEKPNIVAGAYINSVKGAKETALFNIDATIGGLIKQAPPNDGVLAAIGKLGVKADSVAFDIWSDGAGKNEAWLMADGTLYSVDLATGKATEAAKIAGVSGTVKDIAIMGM